VWATEGDTGYDCAGTFHGLAVRCVVDDCVDVPGPQGSRIAVAGLSSVLSRGRMPSRARAVMTSCPRADLSLVMAHRPDYVANLVDQGRVSLAWPATRTAARSSCPSSVRP